MGEPLALVGRRAPGMVLLRCDPADAALAAALDAGVGCAVPGPRRIVSGARGAAAWMAPDEAMLFTATPTDAPSVRDAVGTALAGSFHLAVDVSDARTVFRLTGAGARAAIAKGAPVDLAPGAFGPGDFRRTRLGQVAAAIWMPDPDAIELMGARSVADFVADWLASAVRPGGAAPFF